MLVNPGSTVKTWHGTINVKCRSSVCLGMILGRFVFLLKEKSVFNIFAMQLYIHNWEIFSLVCCTPESRPLLQTPALSKWAHTYNCNDINNKSYE